MTICRTVAELIEALKTLPPDAVPMAQEPPFTGVQVIPQDSGRVYLASLHGTPEAEAYLAERASKPAAITVN
jgi:hypothetical protein